MMLAVNQAAAKILAASPLSGNPEIAWVLIALVAGAMVIACLRVLGFEANRAIAWYDLRLEVQALRRQQQRRLENLARSGAREHAVRPAGNTTRADDDAGGARGDEDGPVVVEASPTSDMAAAA